MVGLALLLVITLLPVSTAINSIQDLLEGPVPRQVQTEHVKRDRRNSVSNRSELYLKHSERILEGPPD